MSHSTQSLAKDICLTSIYAVANQNADGLSVLGVNQISIFKILDSTEDKK